MHIVNIQLTVDANVKKTGYDLECNKLLKIIHYLSHSEDNWHRYLTNYQRQKKHVNVKVYR